MKKFWQKSKQTTKPAFDIHVDIDKNEKHFTHKICMDVCVLVSPNLRLNLSEEKNYGFTFFVCARKMTIKLVIIC